MMRYLAMTTMAFGLWAGMSMAEPLVGLWQTAKDDNGDSGLIEVTPCGDALCGELVKSYNAAGQEIESTHIGRNIISDTVPTGDGAYRGKIYSPDRDKTYNARLQLDGDRLDVSGCVFGICRDGGRWKKIR